MKDEYVVNGDLGYPRILGTTKILRGIYGPYLTDGPRFAGEREAQAVADLMNSAYRQGYARAREDIRDTLRGVLG